MHSPDWHEMQLKKHFWQRVGVIKSKVFRKNSKKTVIFWIFCQK